MGLLGCVGLPAPYDGSRLRQERRCVTVDRSRDGYRLRCPSAAVLTGAAIFDTSCRGVLLRS